MKTRFNATESCNLDSFPLSCNITNSRKKIYINDKIIRFYDYCDRYIENVEEDKTAYIDYEIFGNGKEMQSVLKNVEKRYKLGNGYDTGKLIYDKQIYSYLKLFIYNDNNKYNFINFEFNINELIPNWIRIEFSLKTNILNKKEIIDYYHYLINIKKINTNVVFYFNLI